VAIFVVRLQEGCKPNSVYLARSDVTSAPHEGENHLSDAAIPETPPSFYWMAWSGPLHGFPIWPCTRWGLPCLPPYGKERWALTPPFHPYRVNTFIRAFTRRSVFCGTFRRYTSRCNRPHLPTCPSRSRPAATMWLCGIVPYGVRTFLPRYSRCHHSGGDSPPS